MAVRVIVAGFAILVVFGAVVWPQYTFYMQTGRFSPIKKIAKLESPVAVKGWTTNALLLADGRAVPVPEVQSLPLDSAVITDVTRRGVEIAPDGRIFGLVEVLHGCGNDPVREHIAKVDIADLLIFLKVAESTMPLSPNLPECRIQNEDGGFSKYGWWVSDHMAFEAWAYIKNSGL